MKRKGRGKGTKRSCKLSMVSTAVLLAAIALMPLAVTSVIAQEAEVTVTVKPESECVEEGQTFFVTIDVDNLEEFNAGMFDITFDHKVVEVTDVTEGQIGDTEIPIFGWFADSDTISDTIMVMLLLPEAEDTVSGTGYLAKITFKVTGKEDDECVLDISNGELTKLVEGEAGTMNPEEIQVEWIDAEISVGVEEEDEEGEDEEEDEEEPTPTPTLEPGVTPTSTPEANVTETIGTTPTLASGETPTPTPTLAPEVTPLRETTPAEKTTPKPTAPSTTEEKPTPTPKPEMPGFEVVLAIVGMVTIASILLRRR